MKHPLQTPSCDDSLLWRVWLSAFQAPSLALADDLGLFAALSDEPRDATQLARVLGIELRAVESLTALMCSLELLSTLDGRFHLTESARVYLLPSSPFYWGPMLKRIREIPIEPRRLSDALRRGTAAADGRVTKLWEGPTPSPEQLRGFTHAMHCHSLSLAMRVTPQFGWPEGGSLLDAAGGSGAFSIAAATHDRSLRCTVLDLPAVCEVASEYIHAYGVEERVRTLPLDMFREEWPASAYDRVLFNDIFHDWNDEFCRVLAERARHALRRGGRVLVHEMTLNDDKSGPLLPASYSMVMVYVAQGRQRTTRELVELLEAAGLRAVTARPTANGYVAVTGAAAD